MTDRVGVFYLSLLKNECVNNNSNNLPHNNQMYISTSTVSVNFLPSVVGKKIMYFDSYSLINLII